MKDACEAVLGHVLIVSCGPLSYSASPSASYVGISILILGPPPLFHCGPCKHSDLNAEFFFFHVEESRLMLCLWLHSFLSGLRIRLCDLLTEYLNGGIMYHQIVAIPCS